MADDSNNSGAWASAAGNAAGIAGNYLGGIAQSKKQQKFALEAMQKQQEMNTAAWEMQNAYNSPTEQMKRLKAAGLNPHLIYGSNASSGLSGTLTPAEVPTRQAAAPPDVNNTMFTYLQARQMDAQYKATIANTEMAQRRTAILELEAGLKNFKLLQETKRSKNYGDLALAEVDTKKWIALRAGELYANEKSKGMLMDQMGHMNQKKLTSYELDNEFKKERNQLAKIGIYSTDHPAFRILIQASQRLGLDLGDFLANRMSDLIGYFK